MRRRLAAAVSVRSRAKKIQWLTDRIPADSDVLLVGVSADAGLIGTANVVEAGLMRHARTTALVYDSGRPELPCKVVRGSALSLPFGDGSFDYVVSNAVIEHVGGPLQARSMIAESQRVARRAVYHTTPWRWSPVEVHTQLPLLHWLPRTTWPRVFAVAGQRTMIEDCWLFGRRELRAMGASVQQLNLLTLIGTWPAASSPDPAQLGPARLDARVAARRDAPALRRHHHRAVVSSSRHGGLGPQDCEPGSARPGPLAARSLPVRTGAPATTTTCVVS